MRLIVWFIKLIKDSVDKISEENKKDLNEKVDALKKQIEKEDYDKEEVKKTSDELMNKLQEVGAKLYEGTGSGSTETPTPEEPKTEENKDEEKEKPTEGEVV